MAHHAWLLVSKCLNKVGFNDVIFVKPKCFNAVVWNVYRCFSVKQSNRDVGVNAVQLVQAKNIPTSVLLLFNRADAYVCRRNTDTFKHSRKRTLVEGFADCPQRTK